MCKAIDHVADRIRGRTLSSLVSNWGETWRYLVSDSQLRWIGPEKGVIHLALGAVVNAIWDVWAKSLGKPVWRIVAEMRAVFFMGDSIVIPRFGSLKRALRKLLHGLEARDTRSGFRRETRARRPCHL